MHWLIGDLQGCVRALEDFCTLSGFDPNQDELWCLGDLVNKGPATLETLNLWRDLGGKAVLGNHEIYALSCWKGQRERKQDTLDSLLNSSVGEEHLATLMQAPLLHNLKVENRSLWLVHGGLHPHWSKNLPAIANKINQGSGLERLLSDEAYFATRVRCCTAQGEMSRFFGHPRDCPVPYSPWDSHYQGEALVVHGHWAMRGHYIGAKSIGLDGGYVYGRSAWAYCVQEDRVLEVPNPDAR